MPESPLHEGGAGGGYDGGCGLVVVVVVAKVDDVIDDDNNDDDVSWESGMTPIQPEGASKNTVTVSEQSRRRGRRPTASVKDGFRDRFFSSSSSDS